MRKRITIKLTWLALLGISVGLCLLVSPRAEAQGEPVLAVRDWPKVEVGGDFDFVRANAPPARCGCFTMFGADGWLSYSVLPALAVVGQVSYQTASDVAHGRGLSLTSILAGPRISHEVKDHFVPFGQVLFGVAHAGGTLAPGAPGFAGSANALAATAGGGLDYKMTRRFTIRVAELDYFLTHFDNGSNNRQNNVRLSAGLIVSF